MRNVPVMRKAKISKNTKYKLGERFTIGDNVIIQETFLGKGRYQYLAIKESTEGNLVFSDVVTRSQFEFTEDETFIVTVIRESYCSKNIEVQAKNREEAEAKAISDAGNMVFSEEGADYRVLGLFTKKEHENLFK